MALTLTTWVRDDHFEGVQKEWVWELMFCLLGQYVFHGTFGTYCDNGMLCPMDGNPGGLAGSGAGHWPCHLAPFPVEDVVRIDMIVYNPGEEGGSGKHWVQHAC